MGMIRGKIEAETEVMPRLVVIGGNPPVHKNDNGDWVLNLNPDKVILKISTKDFLGKSFTLNTGTR